MTDELKKSSLFALCELILQKWNSKNDEPLQRSFDLLINCIIDSYYDENEVMLRSILDNLHHLSII